MCRLVNDKLLLLDRQDHRGAQIKERTRLLTCIAPPNSSAGRDPAGSGRLCDGRTAAPNLQRRQLGCICGGHTEPTAAHHLHQKKTTKVLTACSCWREPLGEEGLLLRGDRVSVHLTVPGYCMYVHLFFSCSAARGCGYSMIHALTHSLTHTPTLPHICTHSYTYQTQTHALTPASHGLHKPGGQAATSMEPPPMPNSIADAILLRAGGGDR